MKGNQNIFDIHYNKEEEGRREGRGDGKGGGSGRGREAGRGGKRRRPKSDVTNGSPGFHHFLSKVG